MKIIFGKAGGLIVNTQNWHFCIFPANCWFARSKQGNIPGGCIVAFKIGFSWSRI